MKWVNDEAAQVVLLDMGIETVETVISVGSIDRKKSSENRARATPLDDTRIDGIAAAAAKGVPIPKIVVRSTGDCYVIVGGNHRFAACGNVASIPVHVVTCTDAEFETACRVLNTVVGVGMTKAERVQSAVSDVQRLGITRTVAARLYGLSPKEVSVAIVEVELCRRATEVLPVHIAKKVSKTHLKTLADLSKNDNVLRAACNAVAMGGLTVNQFSDVVKTVRTKTTEAEQIAVFENIVSVATSGKGKIIPRKKRAALVSILNNLEKLNTEAAVTWAAMEVETHEVTTMKERLDASIHILQILLQVDG